jgi:hypothetical protein
MKIETIYDKGIAQVNEDAFLVADPVFGVFDGVSGLEPYMNEEGQSGASIASSTARDVFAASSKSLIETAIDANNAIGNAMREKGIDASRKTAQWATTATAIKINDNSFDWLKIGDSPVMAISHDGSFQFFGSDSDGDLEIMLKWKELAEQKTENIRSVVNDYMIKARSEAENYGDLNGESGVEKFLEHGTASLERIAHIILFTDGLRIPKEDPREPDDYRTFVELFLEGGLTRVQDFVREREATDPKCWKYSRFKQHDDIAAVSISF